MYKGRGIGKEEKMSNKKIGQTKKLNLMQFYNYYHSYML